MTSPTHPAQSTAAILSVACELSAKEGLLTMSPSLNAPRQRARVRPGDRAGVERALADTKRRFGLAADDQCGVVTKRAATDSGRIDS